MSKVKDADSILINTHKKENINLLRARDFYFRNARNLNRLLWFINLLPPVFLIFSYLLFRPRIQNNNFNDFLDVIIGITSTASYFLTRCINNGIDKNLTISNMLREEYDVNVLGIKRNDLVYDRSDINKYIKKSEKYKTDKKYEVWYGEIFSGNRIKDTIICQMDNIIYTKHAYSYLEKLFYIPITFFSLVTLFIFLRLFISKNFLESFLFLFSVFSLFTLLIDKCAKIRSITKKNNIITSVVDQSAKNNTINDTFIRCFQDSIIEYRNKSIFLLTPIRKKYLKDGNKYYKELDSMKNDLYGKDTGIISSAEEIPVLSESGNNTLNLAIIQKHLTDMLSEISSLWSTENIDFMLTGSSLLGAVREKGKMLFWDDCISLSVPADQIKKAKELIKNGSKKYIIQDSENEPFFCPVSENFIIREKKSSIRICERNNPVSEFYENKGIFIKVYSRSPVIKKPAADRIYKFLFLDFHIHRLLRIENKLKTDKKHQEKLGKKYLNEKDKFLNADIKYRKKQLNTDYCVFNLRKSNRKLFQKSIYVKAKDIKNNNNFQFENISCGIPEESENILNAIYGKQWSTSPYKSKEALMKKAETVNNSADKWFSLYEFKTTVLSHIEYADITDKETAGT